MSRTPRGASDIERSSVARARVLPLITHEPSVTHGVFCADCAVCFLVVLAVPSLPLHFIMSQPPSSSSSSSSQLQPVATAAKSSASPPTEESFGSSIPFAEPYCQWHTTARASHPCEHTIATRRTWPRRQLERIVTEEESELIASLCLRLCVALQGTTHSRSDSMALLTSTRMSAREWWARVLTLLRSVCSSALCLRFAHSRLTTTTRIVPSAPRCASSSTQRSRHFAMRSVLLHCALSTSEGRGAGGVSEAGPHAAAVAGRSCCGGGRLRHDKVK